MASLYFADQKAKKARGEEQEEKEEKSSDASGSSSQTPITAPSRPTLLGKQRQTIPDAESVTSSTIAPMSFVGLLYNDDASDFEPSGLYEVDLYVDENPHVVGDKRSGWQQRQEPAPNNHRALYVNTVLRASHYGDPDPEEEGSSWKRASGSTTSGVSFLGPRSVAPIGTGRVPEHKSSDGSKRSRLGFIKMLVLALAILGAAGAVIGVVVSKTNKRSGNKTDEQEGKVPSPPSNTDLSSSLDEPSPGTSRPEPPNTSSPTLIARTSSEPTNAPTPLLRITTPAPTPLASVKTTDSVTVLFPLNDECSQATTAILGGRYEGSTTFANFDMVGLTGCLLAEDDGPGVWYQIMGTGVPITASTCNSNTDFDTKINVVGGSCEGNDFTCEAANDDACGFGQTRVSWFGTEGTLYYVLLSGYGGSVGNYELTFESVPVLNDSCDAATTLDTAIPVQTFPGSTTFAEFDVVKECADSSTNSISAGVWYRMDAVSDGNWTLSTCLATDFDTRLVVFEGDSCNNLVCVVNNDDGCGEENFGSSVDLAVTAGTSYYVFVSGFNRATGNFTLEVVEQQQ